MWRWHRIPFRQKIFKYFPSCCTTLQHNRHLSSKLEARRDAGCHEFHTSQLTLFEVWTVSGLYKQRVEWRQYSREAGRRLKLSELARSSVPLQCCSKDQFPPADEGAIIKTFLDARNPIFAYPANCLFSSMWQVVICIFTTRSWDIVGEIVKHKIEKSFNTCDFLLSPLPTAGIFRVYRAGLPAIPSSIRIHKIS